MKMMTKRILFMVRPDGSTELDWGFDASPDNRVAYMIEGEPDGCKLYWVDITVPAPEPEPEVVDAVVTEVQA